MNKNIIILFIVFLIVFVKCSPVKTSMNHLNLNSEINLMDSITVPLLELKNERLFVALDTFIFHLSQCAFTTKKRPYYSTIVFQYPNIRMGIYSCQDFNEISMNETFAYTVGCFIYRHQTFIVTTIKKENNTMNDLFNHVGYKTFKYSSVYTQFSKNGNKTSEQLAIFFFIKENNYIIDSISFCSDWLN